MLKGWLFNQILEDASDTWFKELYRVHEIFDVFPSVDVTAAAFVNALGTIRARW